MSGRPFRFGVQISSLDPAQLVADARRAEQVAHVRTSAGDRVDELELSALVQVVTITDDRDAALSAICDDAPGLSIEHASVTPYLAVGTHDQIAEQLRAARERWGITYFQVRAIDAIAPVIQRLRADDVSNGTP